MTKKENFCLRNGLCDLHYYFISNAHKLQFIYAAYKLSLLKDLGNANEVHLR